MKVKLVMLISFVLIASLLSLMGLIGANADDKLIWAVRAGGTHADSGYATTRLSDDSIVVSGFFRQSATFGPGEINETTLVSPGDGDGDVFIARYNSGGTLAWAKRAGSVDFDEGRGLTTLSDDSVVLIGKFSDQATFGSGETNETVLVSNGSYDIFIARYNSDGTLVWAKNAGSTLWDGGYAVTALSDNSVVVSGFFRGSSTFGAGETNETVLVSESTTSRADGDVSTFIARYNSDGTLVWAKGLSGLNFDDGRALATLSDNTIVLSGSFMDDVTFGAGEANETVLSSSGARDIFLARYNTDGSLAWVKRAGSAYTDESRAVTVLSDNSIVVTGRFAHIATFGPGETNETNLVSGGKGGDTFVARYNPDGTLVWAKYAGGIAYNEGGYGITTLSDNSVVVTGLCTGSATFGTGETNETILVSAGDYDVFVSRYNADGSLVWAKSAGGESRDAGFAITALSDDSVVVTGNYRVTVSFGSGESNETKLVSAGGGGDIFLARYLQ